jgi:hypothetical protein
MIHIEYLFERIKLDYLRNWCNDYYPITLKYLCYENNHYNNLPILLINMRESEARHSIEKLYGIRIYFWIFKDI